MHYSCYHCCCCCCFYYCYYYYYYDDDWRKPVWGTNSETGGDIDDKIELTCVSCSDLKKKRKKLNYFVISLKAIVSAKL